jgi:hypothetical protein
MATAREVVVDVVVVAVDAVGRDDDVIPIPCFPFVVFIMYRESFFWWVQCSVELGDVDASIICRNPKAAAVEDFLRV